ncbi:MAG: hypothetical protein LIP01_00410 [Tannerellaceae bacterium]|nr:hypothetical protein [Tannerellaceae bacterium]
MQKLILILFILVTPQFLLAEETPYDHIFFDQAKLNGAWFYSEADYSSPSYLQMIQNKLPVTEEQFFTPKKCNTPPIHFCRTGFLVCHFTLSGLAGKDFLKETQNLEFRLLIAGNTLPEELPAMAIGTLDKENLSSYIPIGNYIKEVNPEGWIHIHIPLQDFKGINYIHSSEIKRLYFKQNKADGKEHTLYIDQIELTPVNQAGTNSLFTPQIQTKPYEKHIDIRWDKSNLTDTKYIKIYRSTDKQNWTPAGIQEP